ncbi:hypothetical protein [Rheinheimera gaetbuli]
MTFNQIVTDWKFWSVAISFTALVLSQLPPIHILMRKARLDLEVYSRIFITHKVGNPNLQVHLILRNVGGRSLRVRKIDVKIARDGQNIMYLPAQSYVSDPKDNQLVLLTSFNLKPEEEWNYLTSFLNYFDRNDEKTYREAELKLKNEIIRQKDEHGEKHFALAPPEIVKPLNELFNRKYNWQPGDYSLEISIATDNSKANISKQFRFTIFESQSDSLIQHKEGYPSGAGIYWDSPVYAGIWVNVEERNG